MIRGLEEQLARVRAGGWAPGRTITCEGKEAHPTAAVARRVADRRAHCRNETPLQAYRCQHCGLWHTGRVDRSLRLEGGR